MDSRCRWLVRSSDPSRLFQQHGCKYEGAKVTKDEYYDAMKKTTTGQATLRNMIVLKALEQQYPNKVSDKKVNSQFNKLKKQYGSSFDSTLEQNGYTESSFKDQIRTTLYSEVALKDMKKPTTKQIESQWKSISQRFRFSIF